MSKSPSVLVGLLCLSLVVPLLGCQQRRLPRRIAGKERILVTMGGIQSNESRPMANVHFRDVTERSGLRYTWKVEGGESPNILQTIGNGCAFLDFNNDGNLDILLVGKTLALYAGDGKGGFTDVTSAVGLNSLNGTFLGCAYGDIDSDGFDDLYISGYGSGVLLHNNGGKSFTDITASAGLTPQPWGTSCAFGETRPGTGKLDLYIANYVVFGPKTDPQLCDSPAGPKIACGPEEYEPRRGVFYRNEGQNRFTDISASGGFQTANGKGLGVAFVQLTDSPHLLLLVANDGMPGDTFDITPKADSIQVKNISALTGTALDRDGNTHAGMGIDVGDYNNDGKLDFFVTTFANEPRSLYKNNGELLFNDWGMSSGFTPSHNVAFGCKFLDFDNDGWLDLIQVNGHPQKSIDKVRPGTTYRQASQLFHNSGGPQPDFKDVSVSSTDLMKPIVGRGVAVGDYDNDGRQDLLIVDSDGPPVLLHNECTSVGHWLGASLIGTKSNRDGYGATLIAQIGNKKYIRQCQSNGSYLSASDKRVHIGVGPNTRIDLLTVKWPGGAVDRLKNVPLDRYITIKEGETKAP